MRRKSRIATMLGLVLVAMLAVPSTASATDSAAGTDRHSDRCERQVSATLEQFNTSFLGRDLETFASLYRDDTTVILPLGTVFLTKQAAIDGHFRGLFLNTSWTATFTQLKLVVDDCETASALIDGVIRFPTLQLHFLAILTLTRDHGKWRILSDQTTLLSSGPPTA